VSAESVAGRMRSRWWVVALCAVLGVAIGAAVGAVRKPTFAASAIVSVGPLSASSESASSTTADLASDYAAVLTTVPVESQVATAVHADTSYVAAHLSSEAVTGTPLIEITGTGKTAAAASAVADAASRVVVRYFSSQTGRSAPTSVLLSQYAAATKKQQSAKAKLSQLESAPGTSAAALGSARVAVAVAGLRVSALASAYTASTQASGLGTDAVPTVISAAATASSDRMKKLGEFALVGLIAGLCLGASLLVVTTASG
jgi:capsular polysaccharide biosynthesis protein